MVLSMLPLNLILVLYSTSYTWVSAIADVMLPSFDMIPQGTTMQVS